jgi:predicted phosphodiesterase
MKKIFLILIAIAFFPIQSHAVAFAVMGDTQKFKTGSKSDLHRATDRISASGVDFTLALGDFCSGKNCSKKLNNWKSAASPIFPNIYPVHGNHDAVGAEKWRSVFNPPANGPNGYFGWTYSFDFENSHFVVLDTSRSRWHTVNSDQRSWLEQDLAANAKENTFVFFHEPAFPVSKKIGDSLDANPSDRNALWKILDDFNVTAVFSGHEHLFARKKIDASVFSGANHEIYQFTVGNTASYAHRKPLRPVEYYNRQKSYLTVSVDGTRISTNLYSTKGKLLHSFDFSK